MKKVLKPIVVIISLCFVFSCDKMEEHNNPAPTPTPTPKEAVVIDSGVDTKPTIKQEGGEAKVSFTATENWTASIINTKADSWISLDKTSGSAGSVTITITVQGNDTPDDRSATVQIKAGNTTIDIVVSQKGKDSLTTTASKNEFGSEGGELTIEVKANIDFTYSIAEGCKDWISESGTKAMTTTTLTFKIAENEDVKKREGSVTIKSSLGEEVIKVYQSGTEPTIVITQNEYSVEAKGETIQVEVSSNVNVEMDIPDDCDWIKEEETKAISTNTFYLNVLENTSLDSRTAKVVFKNAENGLAEEVTIKQVGREAIQVESISLDKSELTLSEGDSATLIATVFPEDAYNKNVAWSSSNDSIAKVEDGTVTAIKAGTATVTAMAGDKTAICAVKVIAMEITNPFTITSVGNTSVSIVKEREPQDITLIYRKESGKWSKYTIGSPISLGDGEKLQFAAGEEGNASFSQYEDYYHFDVSGNGTINVSGNIMSLLDGTAKRTTMPECCFFRLFTGCDKLVDAGDLVLPATNMASFCYFHMFYGCTLLTAAPELPATTLDEWCYAGMFSDCTSLTKAPELPATTLFTGSYAGMFYGCSSLNYIHVFFSTTPSSDNTNQWLKYVSPTGTFVKDKQCTWDVRGVSGIPEGWAVFTSDFSVTAEPSNVSYHTATVSGRLTVESDDLFSKSATLYYSRTANTMEDLRTNGTKSALTLDPDGFYTTELSPLVSDTEYYYMVIAMVGETNLNTAIRSFKTLMPQASVTADASNVKCNTATVSGRLAVESEGTFNKSATLYYSSTANTLNALKANGTKSTLTLDSDGSYSVELSSLDSDTEYFYVVSADVDETNFNSVVTSFKTQCIQASITADASNVKCYTATVSGKLTVESEGTFNKSATLYYDSMVKTLEHLMVYGTKSTLTLGPDGSYSVELSSLDSDTEYFYVIIAEVDEAKFSSDVSSFTTLSIQASVTAEHSNVSYHNAAISGKLSVGSEGSFSKSATLYYRGSKYYDLTASTVEDLKAYGKKNTLTLDSDGSYSVELSSLDSDTEYFYVVIADVDGVNFNSVVASFKTQCIQASVNIEYSNVTTDSATISGKLTVESEGTFNKSATLYYDSSADNIRYSQTSETYELTLTPSGDFSICLKNLKHRMTYNCHVVAKLDDAKFNSSTISFTILMPPCPSGAVDLGLSIYWAACNLGASKPEEFGDYFQWAGVMATSSGENLDWDNCPYHVGSDRNVGWTKYHNKDNKTVLDPCDDPAYCHLGEKWHMPKIEDWYELESNCSKTWTSINGIWGYKFQSLKPGFTDNWIFLPASGYREQKKCVYVNECCIFWIGKLTEFAWLQGHCHVLLSPHLQYISFQRYRYCAVPARPVSE